eukprot:2963040-Prymnesium_polylepis.1
MAVSFAALAPATEWRARAGAPSAAGSFDAACAATRIALTFATLAPATEWRARAGISTGVTTTAATRATYVPNRGRRRLG